MNEEFNRGVTWLGSALSVYLIWAYPIASKNVPGIGP